MYLTLSVRSIPDICTLPMLYIQKPVIILFWVYMFQLALGKHTQSIFNMTDHKMIHYTPLSTFQGNTLLCHTQHIIGYNLLQSCLEHLHLKYGFTSPFRWVGAGFSISRPWKRHSHHYRYCCNTATVICWSWQYPSVVWKLHSAMIF